MRDVLIAGGGLAGSAVAIQLGRLGVAVERRRVSGSVRFNEQTLADSSVDLAVKAYSLTVVDPDGSDTDRREVQSTMARKDVLDTEKYPEIHFISTGVKGEKTNDGWEVAVEGRLTLQGVEKPIGLPLRLTKRAGELSAEGDVALLQTDFGITPIKVGGAR